MSKLRVLLTGCDGQLGNELSLIKPDRIELYSTDYDSLDITRRKAIDEFLIKHKIDVIINCAAYTAVDKAETEVEAAMLINKNGAVNLGLAAAKNKIKLIHVSTDFIFDGSKSSPYLTTDSPSPINVYGKSKWQAEQELNKIDSLDLIIIRTSWVYSIFGNNFVKTMLRLMQEKDSLSVVSDQAGTPSWAHNIAEFIWHCVLNPVANTTYHWSDAGVASWYDFAVRIQEEAYSAGMLNKKIPIHPVNSSEYPQIATRPAYSVLDKSLTWQLINYIKPQHWSIALQHMIKQLAT